MPRPLRRRPFAGFTLVELLVVLAVLSILAVGVLPSLKGLLGSVRLKGGGNAVVAELNLARQVAGTRNMSVAVRIYKVPLSEAGGDAPYRAFAVVIPASASGAAADEFVGKPILLPAGVVVVADTTYSSLLDPSASPTLPPVSGVETNTAPMLVRGQHYVGFSFLPAGSLNLDSAVPWCLTLASQQAQAASGSAGAPASNYIAIVMDAQSGRASVFQP